MAQIHLEDKDNARIIRVQGSLSILDSSVLREHLLEALSTRKDVIMDLMETDTMDVACMQVLCSAHKTFFKAGKTMRVAGELSSGVTLSLNSIALDPRSCDREPHGTCLWATGGAYE